MASIKVNEITLPEHYVRDQVKSSHVNDLLDVVASANGVKDWKELIGKKIDWPFDPIDIGKNLAPKPEPAKKGEKKPKGEKPKRWFPFEIIDGAHRWTVAKRLRLKDIDATTRTIDNPADRFMHQYRTNVSHGLRLDKDTRDNAVRIMVNVYKMGVKEVAKEAGIAMSSVSRIANSKQRKTEPRKKAARNPKKGQIIGSQPSTGNGVADGMTVEGFLERLQTLAGEFHRLQAPILSYLVTNISKDHYPDLKEFAGKVRAIAETLDDAMKPESQPKPETQPTAS